MDTQPLQVHHCSDAYRVLDERRTAIDEQLATLPPDDDRSGELWDELDALLAELPAVVAQAAETPARHRSELRAKATMLAGLLATGTVFAQDEAWRLALSVVQDIGTLV